MPINECSLPITDLSIQRGVGTFDSVRIYEGRAFALDMHLKRLCKSAKGAGIQSDNLMPEIREVIIKFLSKEENSKFDGIAKPYITGGDINNKGNFPSPRFFVIFEDVHLPSPEQRKNGIALEANHMARPFPLVKSTNYLYGLIPLSKATSNFESLYITDGKITEAMSSNFFLCIDGKIVTAPIGEVLNGVTRDIILTLAKEHGFKIEERCPLESELAKADEAFITGTVKEILSVVKVSNQKIGSGYPGPVAQILHQLFIINRERWLL